MAETNATSVETLSAETMGQYLTFRVQDGEYGVGIGYVKDIIRMQKITPVPHTDRYIKGITNLRGAIVPVLDMRLRFGLQEDEHTDRTCIVILEMGNMQIGIIVDEVQEVLKDVNETELQPPPKAGAQGAPNRFVKAIGMSNGRVKQFLDIDKVFDTDGY